MSERHMIRFAAGIIISVMVGCSGGGGGAPAGGPVKGTFVRDAHKASVGPWVPGHFEPGVPVWRTQHLYSGTSGTTQLYGSGYITAIGFKADTAVLSSVTCTGVTIKMGHTSLDALSSTFADNYGQSRGSVVTVLNDRVVTIPTVTAGGYFMIDLDKPFLFDGVEKLVVDYQRAGTCTGSVALRYDGSAPADQALYFDDLGSATGILTYPPNMRFRFTGGDAAVEFNGASSASAPFTAITATPSRTQLLYGAKEINGTGPITGIGFQVDQLTTEQTYSYTVTMGHTALSVLSPTFAANAGTCPQTTVAAGSFAVPANVDGGSYLWIPITGAFSYNGTDNLLVDITVTAGSGDTVLRRGVGTAARRVTGAGNATAGTVDDWAYHTRFRFRGGTMDVLTPKGMFGADTFPLAANTGKRQYLYSASELGSRGTIAGIACRNANGNADAIDPLDSMDLTIVVSHTTATVLGADLALNVAGPATVRTGPFSTTPTAWGDWIEFPFMTTFAYNGTDNLVVQFAWTGFAPVNPPACAMDTSAARFPSRRAASTLESAVTGSVDDRLMDLRFHFQ